LIHLQDGTALSNSIEKTTVRVGEEGDLLVIVYYLLLQDRVDEAKELFEVVRKLIEKKKENNVDCEMTLQYDYISAYLDFYSPLLTSDSVVGNELVPPLKVAREV
jgi:hypothetical protein